MLQELEIDINSNPPGKEEVQKAWDEWEAAEAKFWRSQNIQDRLFNILAPAILVSTIIVGLLIKFDVLSLIYLLPIIIISMPFGLWLKLKPVPIMPDLLWICPIEKGEQEEINNFIGRSDEVDLYISKVKAMGRELMHKEYLAIKGCFE